MRKSTILIISILSMLFLAGSLMGFTITMNTVTNRNGNAIIRIYEGSSNTVYSAINQFSIVTNSQNTKTKTLPNNQYRAEIEAWNGYAHVKQTRYFNEYTGSITFDVDLSGTIPDDPPIPD